jgi:hypothetical protein
MAANVQARLAMDSINVPGPSLGYGLRCYYMLYSGFKCLDERPHMFGPKLG